MPTTRRSRIRSTSFSIAKITASTTINRAFLTIGEALVDLVDGAPEPGGAPANVAAALARLGSAAAFVGVVADDDNGACVIDALRAAGVDVSAVVRTSAEGVVTRAVRVERDADGDRRFAGFTPACAVFADTQLTLSAAAAAVAKAHTLVTGSLGLAHAPTRDAIVAAIAAAQDHGVAVVLDVNRRDVFWEHPERSRGDVRALLLPFATTLKASREEAEWLFATHDPGAIIGMHPHVQAVLVTDGARGCSWRIGAHAGTTLAFAIDAVDTTGAGDAFLAGYLHAMHIGTNAADAVRFASAAGALVASGRGAMGPQPDADRVMRFVRSAS